MPPPTPELVNRRLVGILAVVCLAIAAGTWAIAADRTAVIGAFGRVGLVLSALWLAVPATMDGKGWRIAVPFVVGLAIIVGLTRNSRVLVVIVPLLLAIGVLMVLFRPKSRVGPRHR